MSHYGNQCGWFQNFETFNFKLSILVLLEQEEIGLYLILYIRNYLMFSSFSALTNMKRRDIAEQKGGKDMMIKDCEGTSTLRKK